MDTPSELRSLCGHDSFTVDECPTCRAADEIEATRARVAELRQMARGFSPHDVEDDYTPTIQRLHPMNLPDGGGKRLVLAERLVHNRNSKWALVYLVHALLHERDEARAEVAGMEVEATELRQGLWDCFRAAGGDTDGDDTPAAVVEGLIESCVECVKNLRSEYDELLNCGKATPREDGK